MLNQTVHFNPSSSAHFLPGCLVLWVVLFEPPVSSCPSSQPWLFCFPFLIISHLSSCCHLAHVPSCFALMWPSFFSTSLSSRFWIGVWSQLFLGRHTSLAHVLLRPVKLRTPSFLKSFMLQIHLLPLYPLKFFDSETFNRFVFEIEKFKCYCHWCLLSLKMLHLFSFHFLSCSTRVSRS